MVIVGKLWHRVYYSVFFSYSSNKINIYYQHPQRESMYYFYTHAFFQPTIAQTNITRFTILTSLHISNFLTHSDSWPPLWPQIAGATIYRPIFRSVKPICFHFRLFYGFANGTPNVRCDRWVSCDSNQNRIMKSNPISIHLL